MRDVLVVGGGLAGASAAVHLARAGRDVVLVEREAGPHDKVCGEFLSYEAQEDLALLGIDAAALGARLIERAVLASGTRQTETPLGFRALSLSRRVLDEAVMAAAAAAGAEVRRGQRVVALTRGGDGWRATLGGGEQLAAAHAILATGKHDLRAWRRPAGTQNDLLGFKTYWRLPGPGPLDGGVELHLYPGGYAGLQCVEGGRANLCLVIRRVVYADLGGWPELFGHMIWHCPLLAARLDGAAACTPKPLAIAGVPYGLVQRNADGVWRIGDQAAVIPSFTGEGMSLALHSARLAALSLLAGDSPDAFQHRLARQLQGQVRRSTILSQALVTPAAQRLIGWAPPALMRTVLRATRIAGRTPPRRSVLT